MTLTPRRGTLAGIAAQEELSDLPTTSIAEEAPASSVGANDRVVDTEVYQSIRTSTGRRLSRPDLIARKCWFPSRRAHENNVRKHTNIPDFSGLVAALYTDTIARRSKAM